MRQAASGIQLSYLNPKTRLRECALGKGLFAGADISKGEVIIDWACGPGVHVSTKESYEHERTGNKYTLQIDDDLHLVSVYLIEDCDYINHSCAPNCGFSTPYCLVAMRGIRKGEELFFDYAMSEAAECFTLDCKCGSEKCRKTITGSDWKIKSLQKEYQNYFSPYILKKIDAQIHEKSAKQSTAYHP